MKKSIFVTINESNLPQEIGKGIEVGIVTGYRNSIHTHEYQIFDLKNPIQNVGLIGVDDKDIFAITFKSNFSDDFAMAVYLDGINISQKEGIVSLNQIEETKRNNYHSHIGKFICRKHNESTAYLYRYSQKNEENRTFTFTTSPNMGINEVLISDASLENRIEIYLWKEKEKENISYYTQLTPTVINENEDVSKTKIGAGKATNDKYSTVEGLSNPIYVGKAMFVHINSNFLKHLGNTKIPVLTAENFDFDDPMDLVPKS